MTHLVLTEAGIKAFEMPPEPDYEKYKGDYFLIYGPMKEYERSLASAIENGVLLENHYFVDGTNGIGFVPGNMEPNKPYPIPEGWEVVITEKCDSKHYWETAKLIKK
jgi:hypothetical protein